MPQFIGYFDESGTHVTSSALVVAGYIAPADQWERLAADWRAWLNKFSVRAFHMTDWENRQGEFKDWNNCKRHDLFNRLVGILKLRFHHGFSAATIISHYSDFADEFARRSPMAVSPYTFCVLQCFWFVGAWADRYRHPEPIQYVFEDGAGHAAELDVLCRQIEESDDRRRRFRFGGLSRAGKRDSPSLQAADILAYETWKEMANCIVLGREVRPVRQTAQILLLGEDHRYQHGYFDRMRLKEELESLEARLR